MANVLDWTFRLTDRVSAPARSAASGVGEFVQSMHSAMAVMDFTLRGAEALGRGLVSAIAPAVDREKTLGAFETLLGTAEKAREMYGQALKFASETPFEAPEVIKAYQALLTAHIDPVEVPIAMEIVGDATSMAQNSAEALNTVIMQMGQMRSLGKMTMEDLKPIMQATMMDGTRFYQNLAKLYGKSVEQIREMQAQGQISAEAGSFAVLETLQQQFAGNMKRASLQVKGLWSTLSSYPAQYLEAIQDTEGYETLRRALLGVVSVFDPLSEKGKALLDLLQGFGGGLLERLFGDMDGAGADRLFSIVFNGLSVVEAATYGLVDGLKEGLGALIEFNEQATDLENMRATFEAVGKSLGVMIQVMDKVTGALTSFFGLFYDFGDWLSEHPAVSALFTGGLVFNPGALAATGSFKEGFAQSTLGLLLEPGGGSGRSYTQEEFSRSAGMITETGEKTAAGQMVEALRQRAQESGRYLGEGYAEGMDQGVRESLQINSPSRVAIDLGQESGSYTGQGVAQGLRLGLAEQAPSGGAVPVIQMQFNYYASGEDGQDEAMDIARKAEEALRVALERWALQTGRRGA